MADINWSNYTIEKYFENELANKQHLRTFYKSMVDFNPDINGYYLVYFILPDFSGSWIGQGKCPFPTIKNISSNKERIVKLLTFSCVDCSPPNMQVTSDTINVRTGSMPIATEVFESDTINISFLDNRDLNVYNFNYEWILYIKATHDGLIYPNNNVINESAENCFDFGSIDYMASLYVVKFEPDMSLISYIGKATGIFPQNASNKEILGTRNTNSISLVPVTYYCSVYREAVNYNGNFYYYDPFNPNPDMLSEMKSDFPNIFTNVSVSRILEI